MRVATVVALALLMAACSPWGDEPGDVVTPAATASAARPDAAVPNEPPPDDAPPASPESTRPVVTAPTVPGPDTIPFHLLISNQSFQEPDVRLQVLLDGVLVIDEVVPVRDQHHLVVRDLHLGPGPHDIRVVEPVADAVLEEEFTLLDEAWGYVSHWGSSGNGPRLNWQFSLERLQFA